MYYHITYKLAALSHAARGEPQHVFCVAGWTQRKSRAQSIYLTDDVH